MTNAVFDTIRYPMQLNSEGYCGNAIIFVMYEFTETKRREGALLECRNLEEFTRKLFLKPCVFMNATEGEIQMALNFIANPPEIRPSFIPENIWQARILPNHKAILVAIVSHGNTNSFLTADEKLFPDNKIDLYLNETYCPLMRGKPKIIFFNKCRTEAEDVYETISTQPNTTSPVFDSNGMREHENNFNDSSTFNDFIHIYSCSMGTSSLRSKITGSLILSALPDEYELYGRDKEFRKFLQIFRTRMIIKVNKKVQNEPKFANVTQCITTEHDSLLGDIYFPQAGPMTGSDCESLEEMEVEHPVDLICPKELWEISDPSDYAMDSEIMPKSNRLQFFRRIKMYVRRIFKLLGPKTRE
ncbi:Caspase-2 isoform X1 [Oopsacas minuta]|uniref:Caspase-2 isoform X1 n=1 Tax=Oopsacas minuta TaxID=111878 RepID=A0AAV7JXB4_9METZ|nr:Caspase-2 isoform X1 [Oopsacas minuta]